MAPHPGGGGLVILPHKSWNVWNQDNKAKVARDEKANAELIEAKEQCRKETLQQIRFEKLTGKTFTEQEEEDRIQHALDHMDINDYIKDESMREIAQNINDRMKREESENKQSHRKKRKVNEAVFADEESKKYLPRKRHKRNDVSIIEDHYSAKKEFEFDPNQYGTVHRRKYNEAQQQVASNHNNSHFSLFDERNLKKKKADELVKEDDRFKFGRTEIDQRKRSKKAWYLMTSQKEKERRNLMKADEIQRSLPRRLKEYECDTDKLREKATNRKQSMDPLELMQKFMKTDRKQRDIRDDEDYGTHDAFESKRDIKRKRKKDRKKSKRGRKKHRNHDHYSDGEERHKRKRSKHQERKSSKKKKKSHRS